MALNRNFDIDDSRLRLAMRMAPGRTEVGLKNGFDKIKDEWAADAYDEAPQKSGTLRRQIHGTSSAKGVLLRDNAVKNLFNYSYFIHEVKGDDYLDRTLDEEKVKTLLEAELSAALGRLWGGA